MAGPRNRAEAKGTPSEPLWQTPPHWPDDVHMIPINGFANMGIRPSDNALFWDGRPVETKRSVNLEGWSLALAIVATGATVVAAVWPVGLHFGWW